MSAVAHRTARVRAVCSTRRCCSPRCPDAARKLDPRVMVRNPVMFVVEVGAVLSTVLAVSDPSVFALVGRRLALADGASSPTWPRPSPRAAARRRPRRCAGPRPRPIARRLLRRRDRGERRRPAAAARRPGRRRGRARSSPATATSSRASPASTSRRSPASRRR